MAPTKRKRHRVVYLPNDRMLVKYQCGCKYLYHYGKGWKSKPLLKVARFCSTHVFRV